MIYAFWRLEIGNWRLEIRDWRLEIRDIVGLSKFCRRAGPAYQFTVAIV
jgi:hypothetical protein